MFRFFTKSYRKSFKIERKLKKLMKLISNLDLLDWKQDLTVNGHNNIKINNNFIGIEKQSNVISIDYNGEKVISIPKTMPMFNKFYEDLDSFINITIDNIHKRLDFDINDELFDKLIDSEEV